MRRATLVLSLLLSVVFLGPLGCAELERSIVRGKVAETFRSTMTPGSETTDLGGGLSTYRWLSYRTLWLRTTEGIVVFDPLNRDASREIAETIGQAPRWVIYSHGHRDHASGADALGGSPERLAHADVAHELAARDYDDVLAPTSTFDENEHTITLGGEELQLITLHGAHAEALTVTYFPARRLVYAVDLVWPNQLPPPAAPLSYSGVERALDRILELDFDTFVPGHGAVVGRAEVERYRRFLAELRESFRASLERHGLNDLHDRDTFTSAPDRLGEVFYEVIDDLEPRYGDWENYDEAILATVQWCFWSVLTGD